MQPLLGTPEGKEMGCFRFFFTSLTMTVYSNIQFVNSGQKIWAGPSPPLIWTRSKRTAAIFFGSPSLRALADGPCFFLQIFPRPSIKMSNVWKSLGLQVAGTCWRRPQTSNWPRPACSTVSKSLIWQVEEITLEKWEQSRIRNQLTSQSTYICCKVTLELLAPMG